MHTDNHQQKRKRILLVWGYERIGWIEPFVRIRKDFDFQFLRFIHKEEDPVSDLDFPRHYWSSFPDARTLLYSIKPDAIVFMNISNALPISLNIIAHKEGIPTFIMQHGLYSNLETYLNLEKRSRSQTMDPDSAQPVTQANASGFSSKHFTFKSLLGKSPFQLVLLLIYLKRFRTMGKHHAALHTRFTGRLPDKYIAFTHFNMRLVYERDKVGKDKVLVIGNPYYDIYNDPIENGNAQEKYYLLIDQPLVENKYVNYGVSKEMMNEFYVKLNKYAMQQDAKLYIKLHPENYKSSYMIEDDNIKYIRDTDLPSLILRAEGCFGCPSTLMVPCICYKPSILFWLPHMDRQNDFSQYNMCNLLPFDDFQPEDIHWEIENDRPVKRDLFEEHYFYKADGKAVDRLHRILSDPHKFAKTSECQL